MICAPLVAIGIDRGLAPLFSHLFIRLACRKPLFALCSKGGRWAYPNRPTNRI